MKQITLLVCFFLYAFFSFGQAEQIGSFTLVEAGSGNTILELTEGTVLNTATTASGINIRANTVSATVGSVVFSLNGPLNKNMTENVAPYALFGDFNGEYFGENLPEGAYTLTATAFTEERGGGIPGDPFTINFRVVAQPDAKPFITTWDLRNVNNGVSPNSITIPTVPGEIYNYNVDWGDGTMDTGVTGDITHRYETLDEYTVTISGVFPRIRFAPNLGDENNQKIRFVNQWGDNEWSSMEFAFVNCENLDVLATDIPNLSKVTSMASMFANCFGMFGNPTFGNWDVSAVEDMSSLFSLTSFNHDLNNWNVSNVTNMGSMFGEVFFNQDISGWDVSNVTNMGGMFFANGAFNQDISGWNVSKVTNMNLMFADTRFNQDISAWDVSNVTNMGEMFFVSNFDQDLGNWDISNVTIMSEMFEGAGLSLENYDSTLIGWATLDTNETRIPENIPFNAGGSQFCLAETARQELSNAFGWTITDGGLNCDGILPEVVHFTLVAAGTGTEIQPLTEGVVIDEATVISAGGVSIIANTNFETVGSVVFSLSGPENREMTENVSPYTLFGDFQGEFFGRNLPVGTYTLTATAFTGERGGGQAGTPLSLNFRIRESAPEMRPFVTTWDLRNVNNDASPNSITIPTVAGETYDYNVDWGDGTMDTGVTGDISHSYETLDEYTVTISGIFPRIRFVYDDFSDRNIEKIRLVNQWGDIQWSSMEGAFMHCDRLDVTAIDTPDLSNVTSMQFMFSQCFNLSGNPAFGEWDVSTIIDMDGLFEGTKFNEEIGNWDVRNVRSTSNMFTDTPFNQDIGNWDVSNVRDMTEMFFFATSFNQDIGNWNVGNVTTMARMFVTSSFNQDISNWDVSNVTNFFEMFIFSPFNQNLGNWDISNAVNMESMFNNALSIENYDNTLIGWVTLSENETRIPENIVFGAELSNYCLGEDARQNLIDNFNWRIFDDGRNCNEIVPEIVDFTIVEIGTGIHISRLSDGTVISQEDLGRGINIVAQTFPVNGGSILFSLIGPENRQATENVSPYTLFGDFDGEFFGRELIEGEYTLTVTPYSGPDRTGEQGETISLSFTVEAPQRSFITTWKTDNRGPGNNNQIVIPVVDGEIYNYTVDWGDGTSNTNVSQTMTHTYTTVGTYTVSISGMFPHPRFALDDFNGKLLAVNQWGDIEWNSMENAFEYCGNMQVFAEDIPNLSNVRSLNRMFLDCTSLTGNASFVNWNVQNIINMNLMFAGTAFNEDIGNWNVGQVTTMTSMFANATFFNQDISRWNMSNVENMSGMFSRAEEFNQDIGNWDTAQVQRMNFMFFQATAFNQNLGNWNISAMRSMDEMLSGSMLSSENYDNTLIGWSTLDTNETTIPRNITLGANPIQYCLGDESRRSLVDNFGWTITDGDRNCNDAASITSLTLLVLDITDFPPFDEELFRLENEQTYFVNTLFDFLHTIRANTNPETVGSVVFSLSGAVNQEFTDNTAPYTLFEASSGNGIQFVEGTYNLNVTAYTGPNGSGEAGETRTIRFSLEGPSRSVTSDYEVSLYPNKATTTVNVSVSDPNRTLQTIVVHDMLGRKVGEYVPNQVINGNGYALPVYHMQGGMYIVSTIDDRGGVHKMRLLVDH
ncbi:BspA family leucine-rich repeat surface protein [Spongiimicrobium salis]|uniref:BspA family leucine-rich repeat surface protein n=1 Tax=Spongiimicrobium salis TaxID=1667022 RepID=UPI00374D84BD